MFLAVLAFYVVTAIYGNVVGSGVKVCIVDSSTSSISGGCRIIVYNLTSLSRELVASQIKNLSGNSAVLLPYEVAVSMLGNSSCVIAFPEPRYVLIF